MLWCPGCQDLHAPHSALEGGTNPTPLWDWDGSLNLPTFNPSIKVSYSETGFCHSYVRQGVWEFLDDTTKHQLRGFHPLAELPGWVLE